MPLLTLSQITKSYGAETILTGITMQLQPGEKAGLIGPNGSGKTTLLKIIAGEIEADTGQVHLARDSKIGYLPQESPAIPAGTLRRHLEYPLRHIYALKNEIAVLEEEISAAATKEKTHLQERLDRYAALTTRFEEEGGYQVESRLMGVAKGLGFDLADLDRDISSFSGGEKTRARLAGLLLQDLDLLLLDEPTNFLDLAALEWLEKYLRDLSSALVVVSHDRFFLDRVVNRIYALKSHQVKVYNGNYSAYQKQMESELLSSESDYKKMQLHKAREERLVREAKADQRSKRQARSRQKRLDKIEPTDRHEQQQNLKLGLGYSGRSGRQVVVFDRVVKSFNDKAMIRDLYFEINWGDRIALIGPNGAGKSTLLKLISGSLEPTSGNIRLGPAVKVLYFDQEQEKLSPRQTLLETITTVSDLDPGQARNHLGRYLFRGDDVFKRVADLSGGEKSRLALASLALNSGNCLLMDEPTSHLDLPSLEQLENVLMKYPGTLVIVSHDRFFLKGLANRVFEMSAGDLQIYDLSFAEYLEMKESTGLQPGKIQEDKQLEKQRRQEEHRIRQEAQKNSRRLKSEQASLEESISEAEAKIAFLEKTLSDPGQYGDHAHLAELGADLEDAKKNLSNLLQQWEMITGQLEKN